jgi:glutamyl/glutaminyl-tRNA synthetase
VAPRFVTRFAPSPTGRLHRGHGFSALTAFEAARAAQGRFLLRVEDIDQTRCRPEFDAAILEDLAWLGLDWETPVRRQAQRLADYQAALATLRDRGLLYRCFRTRREIAAAIESAPACRWTPPNAPWAASAPWASRRPAKARKGRPAPSPPGRNWAATWCWRARTSAWPITWR